MNSKKIITLLVLQLSIIGYSQNLSTEVRKDFCKNAVIEYYYGKDAFRGLMNISAKRIGYNSPLEIENAVNNLCSNVKLQDEFFKNINEVSRGLDKEQYISIGMKTQNVELLYNYVLLKYNPNFNQNNNTINTETTNDFVKDTIVINKRTLLKSLYPKSTFLNDSLVLRKENVTYIEGGSEEIEYKTTVVKEFSYIDEKEDEEKLKIILFSTNEKNISYLDILTMVNIEDKWFHSRGSSKRINIEKKKLNNIDFKTIKENSSTYFGMCYKNENKENVIDYYNLNLSLVKTIVENKGVSKEVTVKTTETKENEPALIKDIFRENGKIYISLNIVQIEYTNENDFRVINQNSKIRTFEVSENLKIIDNNCKTINETDYLIKNRERHISTKKENICIFSSIDGIIKEINFGCWN